MDFFETLQIVFEGIRGSGWQGDIAIDDFSLTVGSCEEGIPDPPGPTTPPPPGKFISWISGPPCDERGLFEKTEAQDSYLCFTRIISLRTKLTHISSREKTRFLLSQSSHLTSNTLNTLLSKSGWEVEIFFILVLLGSNCRGLSNFSD